MINKNEIIPIFFTIDDAYAPYLHVALISLIENASKDRNYKIKMCIRDRRKAYDGKVEQNYGEY